MLPDTFPNKKHFAEASFGASNSQTDFESTGFMQASGSARAWKDLDIGGVDLGAGASAPDLVALNGGTILVRAFDGGAISEQLFGAKEIDHDYAEGTDIHPHLHWMPTTAAAGNVKWNLTYSIVKNGFAPPAEVTVSIVQAAPGVAWVSQLASFPVISGVGIEIGDQLAFRLWRDPADVADTYGADAAILTFGYHILIDTMGSRNISSK